MKKLLFLLLAAAFPALSVSGAQPSSPKAGIEQRFFRNVFVQNLNLLEEIAESSEPFRVLKTKTAEAVDPWKRKLKDGEPSTRLYGIVLCGCLRPEEDGEYYLISSVPQSRLYLSPDATEEKAKMLVLYEGRFKPFCAPLKPVTLTAGTRYFFKLYAFPGKVPLALRWAKVPDMGLLAPEDIPSECLLLPPERSSSK